MQARLNKRHRFRFLQQVSFHFLLRSVPGGFSRAQTSSQQVCFSDGMGTAMACCAMSLKNTTLQHHGFDYCCESGASTIMECVSSSVFIYQKLKNCVIMMWSWSTCTSSDQT